jgi:regulation of enolase protein 1 (concanavalin A-like superfamily)
MNQLQAAGIPLRKRIASGIEHWKAMIFAHQSTVYFGSANFSSDAFVYNQQYVNYVDETVYFTNDASVVNSFMTKFDDAWVDTTNYATYANPPATLVRSYPVMSIDPELNFPPGQDYANRSVSRYNAETQRIDAMMFRITDQRHTNAIIAAKGRGVAIRLIVDPGEYRNRARIWDAWNVDRLYAAGVPIRITTHQGENHGKLVMLYGQGLTIFGSSNWSTPSANSQHEHNYFTTKSAIFDWFVTYFNRRWNNSNPAGAQETGAFTPLAPGTPTYQTPASSATGVATSGAKLVWDGGAWAHVYDIYFGTSSNPPLFLANQNLGPDDPAKSPKQLQSVALPTLSAGRTYYWKIVSKTMANVTKTGPIWSFTTAGTVSSTSLPSPWQHADIGAVPIAGSAQYSNGSFSISASGADIWGTADAFHFVYQQKSGDFIVQARVASVQQATTWSKAGVMIRETLSASSKHAFALVSAAKGVALQWRPTAGGDSLSKAGSLSAPPRWVRLQRSGTSFTASESSDGSTWTTIGTASISMASTVYMGLAVTSHSTSATTTAVLDHVGP